MVLGVVCSSHISYHPHQLYDFIEKEIIALARLCMSHVVKIKFIWCSIVATVSLREETVQFMGHFFPQDGWETIIMTPSTTSGFVGERPQKQVLHILLALN